MTATMFQKIWDRHEVEAQTEDCPAVLYIDFHLINEVTAYFGERDQRFRLNVISGSD